jgi:glycosyltransferase involved in cell wall biosynthesis
MKILCVIDNLGSGGAQRQMVTLARELKERGHKVEFFTYYPQDHYRFSLDDAGISVHLQLKTSRFSFSPIFALRCFIKQNNFDIVLSFLDTPNFYAEIACIGLKKTKLVISERSLYPPGRLSFNLHLLQECHRLADSITVNSIHQRQRMIQKFPWMTSKIQTIYNGVDLECFMPDQVRGFESGNNLALIAIGTVVANKNMLHLAKALTISRDRYNVRPIIRWAGKQVQSDAGSRAFSEITRFLQSNRLSDQWEWLGERSDIPDLLRKHDALIHPSFYEGLPNVVCEALASGLPVLASDVCDHPFLVEEGVRGFLFNPHSPDSIAEAINKLYLASHEKRCQMSADARAFAEAKLASALFTDNYEKLFISLIDKN